MESERNRRHFGETSRGFSLAELLVAILIIFILSGLATYAFVGLSEQFRIKAAVQSIDSLFRRARQTAITTRTDRRVVIEMYRDPATDPALTPENVPVRMWMERKKIQFLSWGYLPYDQDPDRAELVSDISRLPEFMRVADVTGVDAPTLAAAAPNSNRVLLYFEFSNTGGARAYFNSPQGRDLSLSEMVPTEGGGALYIHVVRQNERIEGVGEIGGNEEIFYYLPQGGRVLYLNDRTRQVDLGLLINLGGLQLFDITGNEPAVTEYELELRRVNRQMRHQVGTIHLIPQTGRTRAYDYGIGYPWSKIEMREEVG